MGAETKIEWCDHTFNPWRGCTKVSAGCANCYADSLSKRNPGTLGIWGTNGSRVVASEEMWKAPVRWNLDATCNIDCELCHGSGCDHCDHSGEQERKHRPRVFCASLADVFENWQGEMFDSAGSPRTVSDNNRSLWIPPKSGEWEDASYMTMADVRHRLFSLIDATPNLDWLLLTKRPENIPRMFVPHCLETVRGHVSQNDGDGKVIRRRENVWLGTSVSCQEDADKNIPKLLNCRDLCAKLFVSVEPFIGPVNLEVIRTGDFKSLDCLNGLMSYASRGYYGGYAAKCRGVDWVIVGGESGPNARPCSIDWIRSIVKQCKSAGVPCFMKQLGSYPIETEYIPTDSGNRGQMVGVKLKDKKGGDPSEWPEDLRVREFPVPVLSRS